MRAASDTMIPSGPRTYAIRQVFSYSPIPPTRPYPSAATSSTAAWTSATSKATLRRPSSLAIAVGDPGSWARGGGPRAGGGGGQTLEGPAGVPPRGGGRRPTAGGEGGTRGGVRR